MIEEEKLKTKSIVEVLQSKQKEIDEYNKKMEAKNQLNDEVDKKRIMNQDKIA